MLDHTVCARVSQNDLADRTVKKMSAVLNSLYSNDGRLDLTHNVFFSVYLRLLYPSKSVAVVNVLRFFAGFTHNSGAVFVTNSLLPRFCSLEIRSWD